MTTDIRKEEDKLERTLAHFEAAKKALRKGKAALLKMKPVETRDALRIKAALADLDTMGEMIDDVIGVALGF